LRADAPTRFDLLISYAITYQLSQNVISQSVYCIIPTILYDYNILYISKIYIDFRLVEIVHEVYLELSPVFAKLDIDFYLKIRVSIL